jgi:hypothetical protein
MITIEEFHRIQEILGRTGRPRPKRHAFAFTGIVKCGHCGGAVTAEEHVKKSRRRYVYYRCSRHRAGIVCREPAISESALIGQLARRLRFLRIPPKIHDWLIREALAETGQERHLADQVRRTIEQALTSVEREESNLVDMRAREIITEEVLLAKRRNLDDRRLSLREKLKADSSDSDRRQELVRVFNFAARAAAVLQTGTPVQQRMILEGVGLNYTLKGRKVAFLLDKPLDKIAEAGGLSNWSGCLDDVRKWLAETTEYFTIPGLSEITSIPRPSEAR